MKNVIIILFASALFAKIYSQTSWSWKYPLPQGNSISDSWVISEKKIIAVGYPALILMSQDNGETWNERHEVLDFKIKLNSVFFQSESIGWAVGENGTIMKTLDGGESWNKIFVEDSTLSFNDIYFLNDSLGWIASDNYIGTFALLLETKDGGDTWTKNNHVQGLEMQSVYFFSPDTGFTFGDYILKTVDGGESFSVVDLIDYGSFGQGTISTHFDKPNDIWILGLEGDLFHSSDKGSTWQKHVVIEEFKQKIKKINDIYFVDNYVGFLVGENNYNYITTNGGDTWSPLTFSDSYSLTDCISLSNGEILFFEKNGKIFRSDNFGSTLLNEKDFIPVSFNSISFLDSKNGFISGYDTNRILNVVKITDSPFSWNTIVVDSNLAPNYSNRSKIAFSDIDHGYIIETNNVYRTIDAGNSWIDVTSTIDNTIMDICVINNLIVFIANNKGRVFKTINGGESWEQSLVEQDKFINDIEFINEFIGFCCTSSGNIFKTTDGGLTWKLLYEKNMALNLSPTKISFPSADIGWGVSYYGEIIKTEDGGKNWYQVNHGESLYEVSCIYSFNKDNFWISDYKGNSALTIDGGITWSSIPILQDKGITGVTRINDNEFYAIGGSSNLVKINIDKNIVQVYDNEDLNKEFILNQNYPNPFNPLTNISFTLSKSSSVKLKVYDILGNEISTLIERESKPGRYNILFNADKLSSGIYFYQLQIDKFSQTKKMLLIK